MLPLPHFARRSARWSRSQHKRARTPATRPDEPRPRELNFGSAGELSCRMLPGSRTRDVICKAAPFSVSQRVPPTNGSPPAPRATTRPPARFIEDNIVLCVHRLRRCHADCFPPSPAARHRPSRGSHRASLQAIRHASRLLPPWGEIWRGKAPSPHPTPNARPLPSPRGLRSALRLRLP
jgi:hypothetical protein